MPNNRINITLTGIEGFFALVDGRLQEYEDNISSAIDATLSDLRNTSVTNLDASLVPGSKSEGHLARAHQIERDEGLSGRVYVDSRIAPYAAAQNWGVPSPEHHGFVHVKAHDRTITKAYGRYLKTPKTIRVRAHDRRMNIPAKLFFSNAVDEVRPRHQERMQEAIA